MTRSNLKHGQKRLRAALRHPLAMVSLPLAMLLVSRLGGEPALIVAAILVLAGLCAVHVRGPRPRDEDRIALPGADAFDAYVDRLMGTEPRSLTACLLISPDDPADLEARLPREHYDRLLRLLAAQMRPVLRDDDAIARIDRNTLAVALSPGRRLTIESVIQTALQLQRRLDMPVDPGSGLVETGTRLGLALSAERDSAAAVVARARAALAMARPGAIRVADDGRSSDDARAVDLARDLPEAFASGQIVAFFQPQVCAATGTLSGVEALARWRHPRHGLLAPAQFLNTVEAAALMTTLTDTMLSNALGALAEWDRIGISVPRVSVNFALCDLSDPTLVERIDWMLDAAEIAPERLGIEVLESVLNLEGGEAVSQTLWRLRKLGCFIDLDDFGTGNTSIANIRRFAVQRLKIDRSFVRRIDGDPDQRDMVAAILTMAGQLRLETLAEGVETREQHAVLAQLGCQHLQGFGIGHPLPGDCLPGWLAGPAWSVERSAHAGMPGRVPRDVGARAGSRAAGATARPVSPPRPQDGHGKTA